MESKRREVCKNDVVKMGISLSKESLRICAMAGAYSSMNI